MSLPKNKIMIGPDEYLALERESEDRHEYLAGQIYAMVGESPEHSIICINLAREVSTQLKGTDCQAYSPNMKIRTSPRGLYAYPDLTVVCGQAAFHDDKRDVIVNPCLIFEVLSPTTEAYDRGRKFARYTEIETLTDYILVAQEEPRIEHYSRQADGNWLYTAVSNLRDNLVISSPVCRLSLAELYSGIGFPLVSNEAKNALSRAKPVTQKKNRTMR